MSDHQHLAPPAVQVPHKGLPASGRPSGGQVQLRIDRQKHKAFHVDQNAKTSRNKKDAWIHPGYSGIHVDP